MTILLDLYSVPEKGKVELNVKRSFEIKVTAGEAQRQVNRWLLNEVSYMLAADPPALVVGEQVVWRVPAWIGAPHVGRIDVVGAVEVDVETGIMNSLPERKVEIERNLERLKSQVPPYRPRSTDEGKEHLAANVPPASSLPLAEEKQPHLVAKKA